MEGTVIMFEEKIRAANESISEQNAKNGFEKRTYTVTEIQDILDIGRSSAYSLISKNLFNVVRVGRSIRISKKSFDDWLDSSGLK